MGCIHQTETVQIKYRQSRNSIILQTQKGQTFQSQWIEYKKYKLSPSLLQTLICRLGGGNFFSNFSSNQLKHIINKYFVCGQLENGQSFYEKGDQAWSLYFIQNGTLELSTNTYLQSGTFASQQSFLFPGVRKHSAIARSHTVLWLLNRVYFPQVKALIDQRTVPLINSLIFRSPVLSVLSLENKKLLALKAITLNYSPGQYVTIEGEIAMTLGIIITGELGVQKNKKIISTIKERRIFGQNSLVEQGAFRKASLRAIKKTKLLMVGKKQMSQILGIQSIKLYRYNICLWALNKSKKIKLISHSNKDQLIKELKYQQVKRGDLLSESRKPISNIILTLDNKIVNKQGKTICQREDIFGEESILGQLQNQCEAFAAEDGLIAKINSKRVNKIVGKMETALKKAKNMKKLKRIFQNQERKLEQNFQIVAHMGQDNSSLSFAIRSKRYRNLIALLKCVSFKQMQGKRIGAQFIQQLNTICNLELPFLPKILNITRDSDFNYYTFELQVYARLSQLIQQKIKLMPHQIKFAVANILNGIDSLHAHQILASCLNCDSLIIEGDGYITLLDFFECKILKCNQEYRTFTISSTSQYLPPEVVKGGSYSFAADYWMAGIVFYELATSLTPFRVDNDPAAHYRRICEQSPQFDMIRQPQLRNLIQVLLIKSQQKRIKMSRKYRKHSFLAGIDQWKQLDQRQLSSPLMFGQLMHDYSEAKYGSSLQSQLLKMRRKSKSDLNK